MKQPTNCWFYVDAASKDEAQRKAAEDGYTVQHVRTRGELACGLIRYRVYVTEGRGV